MTTAGKGHRVTGIAKKRGGQTTSSVPHFERKLKMPDDVEVTVSSSDATEGDAPAVEVHEGDTTVIVDSPQPVDNPGDDSELTFTIGQTLGILTERVATLEAQIAEVRATADVALVEADVAEDTAEGVGEAVETVADAVVNDDPETLAEEPEHTDSILPTKKHFVHKSWRELMGR